MTQIVIQVDGCEYRSAPTDESTPAEAAEALYSVAADLDRLKIQLEDGSWLVLTKDAARRARLLVIP